MSAENNGGTVEKIADADDDAKGKRQRSSIAFPYMDLEEAVNLARAVHSNVGTGNCTIEQLAPWLKQSPTSSAFRNRLTAAKLFGVVDAEDTNAIHLTDIGKLIVDPQREREGRAKAFLAVPLYAALHNKFKGSVIPPTAALEKELVALGVADSLKDTARRVMERSAEEAGYFEAGRDRLVMPGFVAPGGAAAHDHKKSDGGGGGGGGSGGGTGLNLDPLLIELLKKIPPTADGWAPEKRLRWFKTFAMNVSQIYDTDDEPVELSISSEDTLKDVMK